MAPLPPPSPSGDLAAWWGQRAAGTQSITKLLQRGVRLQRVKRVLPTAAIVLIALALLYPTLRDALHRVAWAEKLAGKLTPELAMVNLDYTGVDGQGRPFTVTADKAVRQAPDAASGQPAAPSTDQGIVTLQQPKAALKQDDGTATHLAAPAGTYDEAGQGVNLTGGVVTTRSDGVTLTSPDLAIDLKHGSAVTDKPAVATGNFGRIEGQGLRLEDGGKKIIFTGQSKAVLNAAEPCRSACPGDACATLNRQSFIL